MTKRSVFTAKFGGLKDMGKLITNKNKVFNAMRRKRKKKLTKTKEYADLRIDYNAYRKEIKVMKQRNLERKNVIKQQLFKNLSQKKAWKHVKQLFKNNVKEMPTLHKNGLQATTDMEKANMLMEHYAEISNNLPKTEGFHQHYNHILISNHFAHLNNQTTNNNSQYNKPYTLDQMNESIGKLKPDAAPGIDGIYNKQILENYEKI